MEEGTSQNQQPIPLVANPGLVRPFGVLIALLAVTPFIWAIRTFRLAGTPVPGNRPTTSIVKSGPYRFSRNPIYLAFSLGEAGLALAADDAWLLVTLLPTLSIMSFVVIPREERYLAARFGEEYTTYKARVGRWL